MNMHYQPSPSQAAPVNVSAYLGLSLGSCSPLCTSSQVKVPGLPGSGCASKVTVGAVSGAVALVGVAAVVCFRRRSRSSRRQQSRSAIGVVDSEFRQDEAPVGLVETNNWPGSSEWQPLMHATAPAYHTVA